jgi:hypothetical protein
MRYQRQFLHAAIYVRGPTLEAIVNEQCGCSVDLSICTYNDDNEPMSEDNHMQMARIEQAFDWPPLPAPPNYDEVMSGAGHPINSPPNYDAIYTDGTTV